MTKQQRKLKEKIKRYNESRKKRIRKLKEKLKRYM